MIKTSKKAKKPTQFQMMESIYMSQFALEVSIANLHKKLEATTGSAYAAGRQDAFLYSKKEAEIGLIQWRGWIDAQKGDISKEEFIAAADMMLTGILRDQGKKFFEAARRENEERWKHGEFKEAFSGGDGGGE